MAIASASGLAARFGILVKNGGVLETLSKIDHVVFDKTGTLTEGRMQIQNIFTNGNIEINHIMALAATLERHSEHNIARAICEWATERNLPHFQARQIANQPGLGIKGIVNQQEVLIGSPQWLIQNQVDLDKDIAREAQKREATGTGHVLIAINGKHEGVITLNDQLRNDAQTLVDELRIQNIRMTILSGDRKSVAKDIAQQLGGMDVIAEVLPEDKDQIIRELQKEGSVVAMIGDGVNDAAALNRADVGIALGSGTDVSGDSADIVLMSNELNKVALAMQLSKRTLRTIRQNIGISLIYNIIMVPLAMAAMITPLVAAISMPISSLLVIGNAVRIRTVFKSSTNKEQIN
jgi:Cu2+-exporting ATPase